MTARTDQPRHRAAILRAAVVLEELSADIEALGAELCADPALVARFVAPLQAIDLIAQKQRAIAGMLRAECPVSGAATIPLEALRHRLDPEA